LNARRMFTCLARPERGEAFRAIDSRLEPQ
jgi:hypothetical protein